MKRSKMVDILRNAILDVISEPISEGEADKILEIIEKSGMLPPPMKNPEYKGPLQQMNWVPDIINKWEENES